MATNVVTVALGPDPINMTCPRCQANIQTAIDTETSGTGMALAVCLCLVGYVYFFLIFLVMSLIQCCPKYYRLLKITEEPKKDRKFKISWNMKNFNMRRILKGVKNEENSSFEKSTFINDIFRFRCIPCCVIPCFMDSMKNTTHSCPKCGAKLGTFTP